MPQPTPSGNDDKDACAFRDGADAIEALLDAPLDLQVQHFEMPRARRAACGAQGGQLTTSGYTITCPACRRRFEKKARR